MNVNENNLLMTIQNNIPVGVVLTNKLKSYFEVEYKSMFRRIIWMSLLYF